MSDLAVSVKLKSQKMISATSKPPLIDSLLPSTIHNSWVLLSSAQR